MKQLPENISEVQKIYFIAEDATGPFRRVIQLLLCDKQILSFENKQECDLLIAWLYDENVKVASTLEMLLKDKDRQNMEVLVYNKDD
jgi:hypothetical protein